MSTAREQALQQTRRTREKAEQLLANLLEAHAACETQMAQESRTDLVRLVRGKSSIEEAIEETRRMIEVLKRAEESEQAKQSPVVPADTDTRQQQSPNSFRFEESNKPAALPGTLTEEDPAAREFSIGDGVDGMVRRLIGHHRLLHNPRVNVLFSSRTATSQW